MRDVAEFENKQGQGRDTYAAGGFSLERLRDVPVVLRHQVRPHGDVIHLFGRSAPMDFKMGAQIFLMRFALPGGDEELARELAIMPRVDFRLPKGVTFDEHLLSPAKAEGFSTREVFRTRDGRTRKRIVQLLRAPHSVVLVVYSLDGNAFAGYPFFTQIAERLSIRADG